jgi:23S rRNA pseudouridine1911/1915/1917 synthase
MNKLFREKTIQKTYWAIVEKPPLKKEDRLEHYLIKNQQKNKSRAYSKPYEGALKSVLDYAVLKTLDCYTLLKVEPISGRHHQIRVQLSTIGCCIKGDLKYGAKRSNKDASISLHAREISFIHPVKNEAITVTAPTPKDALWNACKI